ncbi:MAG: type II toxin-antitoxin system RelE/ParE family toxin [Deltaproteobacteria bacterium]|nr:type II toxin-antitoxin system RelE/ParE family toxin [Deltaproteobacteria bacterium]
MEWTPRADRDRDRLEGATCARILSALERYAETGHGDVKRLRGYQPVSYRLRVGSWRVVFTVDHRAGVVAVVRVLPRGQAYR